MVRPKAFHFNFETAGNNKYQTKPEELTDEEFEALVQSEGKMTDEITTKFPGIEQRVAAINARTHESATAEFDNMVANLRAQLINVFVVQDNLSVDSPDSIFPNNPHSFHPENGGTLIKWAMRNDNRRVEKQLPLVEELTQNFGFQIAQVLDWSHLEQEGKIIEGTGSLVLDREHRVAFAALSQRTTQGGVDHFSKELDFRSITFKARDPRKDNSEIYHTNVMMSVGKKFAVICSDAISDPAEREMVLSELRELGKDIIEIDVEQMDAFAGNILEVQDADGAPKIVMSQTAYKCLAPIQIAQLELYGEIIVNNIDTIEANGGGSARCMEAEVFLPKAA